MSGEVSTPLHSYVDREYPSRQFFSTIEDNIFFQAAQRYGFFCSRLDQSFEPLFPPLLDEEGRWKAWSRVEATKK
jgi:hypothetical protein